MYKAEMGRVTMIRWFGTVVVDSKTSLSDIKVIKDYLKKCSLSWAIRKIQVKTTLRFHLILLKMVKINKTTENKCWKRCWGKGTLINSVRLQTGTATLEISVENCPKLKVNLSCCLAIPHLGLCPRDVTSYHTDTCSVVFIGTVFTITIT